VFVTEDMVGHKLGEFSFSRTFRGHTNKKEGIDAGATSRAARSTNVSRSQSAQQRWGR
jgi:hypothetical protein